MSKIQVDTIVNKDDNGAPSFPKGAVITGVATATNVSVGSSVTAGTFYGSGSNLTGLPAGYSDLDNMLFG